MQTWGFGGHYATWYNLLPCRLSPCSPSSFSSLAQELTIYGPWAKSVFVSKVLSKHSRVPLFSFQATVAKMSSCNRLAIPNLNFIERFSPPLVCPHFFDGSCSPRSIHQKDKSQCEELMEIPLADIPLAEAGHMVKPSISVGGATYQSRYQEIGSLGPPRKQLSMGAGLETGGLSRAEMVVAPLVPGLVAVEAWEAFGFQMYLQTELMVFADDLNVGKA